jgi:hypothetical protein
MSVIYTIMSVNGTQKIVNEMLKSNNNGLII